MTEKLKPCPCCKGKAKVIEAFEVSVGYCCEAKVGCKKCNLVLTAYSRGSTVTPKTATTLAIKKWNKRND